MAPTFSVRRKHTCLTARTCFLLAVCMSAIIPSATGEFRCPSTWHINHDLCYYVSKDHQVTWHQARDLCSEMNATLVTIRSPAEDVFLDTIVSSTIWIGLHDFKENDNFNWVDQTELNFTKWAPGEPNNAGENCVSLYAHYSKGSWNDVVCRKRLKYICQQAQNETGRCADGWQAMSDRCIRFSPNEAATWSGARSACIMLGGDLVVIRNQIENDIITNLMPYMDHWVGLSDQWTEGVFTWLDEMTEAAYFNWHSGEPNNGNNGLEDCVNMITTYYRKGQWATDGCLERYWYACEREQEALLTSHSANITNSTNSPPCPLDWSPHNTSCYNIPQQLATWEQGRAACQALGGHLVTIDSEDEQKFLTGHLNFTNTKVWIGLHDLVERNTWCWLDKEDKVLGFTNWAPSEPSTLSPHPDCVFMHMSLSNRGQWSATRCSRTLSYICEADSPGYCDPGWSLYNGHCYHLNTIQVTWLQAESSCVNMTSHGHLLIIDDGNEQRYIQDHLAGHQALKGIWIGLNSRRKANVFVWPNHEKPSFTNWALRQPMNVTDEKCVERMGKGRGKGQWNDNNCMDDHEFVCRRPAAGEQTFYDFTYNTSIYKIVWHQFSHSDGENYCRRHLGHNASAWRVYDRDELESVGAELTRRMKGMALQLWVHGDPHQTGVFTYYGKDWEHAVIEPGRHCLMVSLEKPTFSHRYYDYHYHRMMPPATTNPTYIMTPRPCCEEKMVICEKTIDGPEDTFEHAESLYRLVSTRYLPYNKAGVACRELLGDNAGLAVLETDHELLAITAEVKARHQGGGPVQYWVRTQLTPQSHHGSAKQQPGLHRTLASTETPCSVLFHDNIVEVAPDKEVFDILRTSCVGAKPFICELQLSTNVPGDIDVSHTASSTMHPVLENSTVAMQAATPVLPPNSSVHMILIRAGCTGPCIGLAIAYPFTIVATILITVTVMHLCKRRPSNLCFRDTKGDHVLLMEIK